MDGQVTDNHMGVEKTCNVCLETKPLVKFGFSTYKQKRNYMKSCRKCQTARYEINNPNYLVSRKANRGTYINTYTNRLRSKDRVRLGVAGDIDKDFVRSIVAQACSYCESSNMLMTLDRIDNHLPHNKNNVVPSCYRCNMIRGNMPMHLWLQLVPEIKSITESGLFGDWLFKPRKEIP